MTNKGFSRVLVCFGFYYLMQSSGVAQMNTITYPAPAGAVKSPLFSVNVNGKDVFTEQIGNANMEGLHAANFSCSGSQTIKITAPSNIKKYVIRPKSLNIKSKITGRELSFTIPGPQKLYIEIDSFPHLAIFANPLEVNPPKEGDPNVIFFGPGVHDKGELVLQSNQTIYIAGGAVVNADVRGKDLQNVKMLGRGVLHGNVKISGTSNLVVDGIFIRHDGRGWTNTLTDCSNSSYNNVKVFSFNGIWGMDGINPVSCRNFIINDCFVRTRDDCISIKSADADHKTDSVYVTNNIMVGWAHADGITLGFELLGLVQNVLVKNCDILYARGQGHTGGHSAFSIVCDNHGDVRNIRFEDIRVEENIEVKNLELIVTEGQRYGRNNTPGHIRGVYLKNVHWENPDKPFVIAGLPFDNNIVEDVTFDHCTVGGKTLTNLTDADFQVEFAKNIRFIPSTKTSRKIISKE